ncbi:MAG: ester cyclase [Nocardioidaceae bacterium]|nr:ester cyclase [Nocardioidaceae bacterium]
MGYSDQERANIALVTAYRSVPMAERRRFLSPRVTTGRNGFHNLGEITGTTDLSAGAIPDREDEVLGIVAHGDEVWALWVVRGTHAGELLGIPATGRPIEVLEMGRWRIEDGLIADGWFMADELALVRQLGYPVRPGR